MTEARTSWIARKMPYYYVLLPASYDNGKETLEPREPRKIIGSMTSRFLPLPNPLDARAMLNIWYDVKGPWSSDPKELDIYVVKTFEIRVNMYLLTNIKNQSCSNEFETHI